MVMSTWPGSETHRPCEAGIDRRENPCVTPASDRIQSNETAAKNSPRLAGSNGATTLPR
jgi:hypothetical protein